MKSRFTIPAVVFCVTLMVQCLFVSLSARKFMLSGDEPHYLMLTISILKDGDFDLANNYKNQDYRTIGLTSLNPRVIEGGTERIYPPDPWGFSLLLLPAFRAGGVTGVRLFLMSLTGGLAVLLFYLANSMTSFQTASGIASVLLCCSPPIVYLGPSVYPEIPLALLLTWGLLTMQSMTPGIGNRAILYGMIPGFMVLIHTRGFALCAGMLLVVWFSLHPVAVKIRYSTPCFIILGATLGVTWWQTGTFYPYLWGNDPYASYRDQAIHLMGLFLDRESGLLCNAPLYFFVVLAGFCGSSRISRREIGVALPFGLNLFLVTLNPQWWGGWSPPCRYMLPLAPLAVLLLTPHLRSVRLTLKSFFLVGVLTWTILLMTAAFRDTGNLYMKGNGINKCYSSKSSLMAASFAFPSLRAEEPSRIALAAVWIGSFGLYVFHKRSNIFRSRRFVAIIAAVLLLIGVLCLIPVQNGILTAWRDRLSVPLSVDKPILLTPPPNATLSEAPRFTWSSIPGSDSYEFYLRFPNGFLAGAPVPGGRNELIIGSEIWSRVPDGEYGWCVVPMRGFEAGTNSDVSQIRKGHAAP